MTTVEIESFYGIWIRNCLDNDYKLGVDRYYRPQINKYSITILQIISNPIQAAK